eukprot:3322319-Rhodomonas_salina.1
MTPSRIHVYYYSSPGLLVPGVPVVVAVPGYRGYYYTGTRPGTRYPGVLSVSGVAGSSQPSAE